MAEARASFSSIISSGDRKIAWTVDAEWRTVATDKLFAGDDITPRQCLGACFDVFGLVAYHALLKRAVGGDSVNKELS
jgi:hypothetical protein